MKAFDPNHKLLDEMYQDDYYPALYETFGPDGQCKLFGVNIFDYDWKING